MANKKSSYSCIATFQFLFPISSMYLCILKIPSNDPVDEFQFLIPNFNFGTCPISIFFVP